MPGRFDNKNGSTEQSQKMGEFCLESLMELLPVRLPAPPPFPGTHRNACTHFSAHLSPHESHRSEDWDEDIGTGGGRGRETALFCVPYSLHNKLPFFLKLTQFSKRSKKYNLVEKGSCTQNKENPREKDRVGISHITGDPQQAAPIYLCKKTHQLRTFAAKEPMIKC